MESKDEIIYVVGEELNRFEFENGIVFIYKDPTPTEVMKYKDNLQYRRHGKEFTTKSTRQQLVLADTILIDTKGLGFKDTEGKIKPLNKNTKAAEIAHKSIEGQAPQSWKDLVPARLKSFFIERIFVMMEEEEKN